MTNKITIYFKILEIFLFLNFSNKAKGDSYEFIDNLDSNLNESCFNVCLCSNEYSIISCTNFTSIEDLNFNLSNKTVEPNWIVEYLFLKSFNKIRFNSSLNLSSLNLSNNFTLFLKNFDSFQASIFLGNDEQSDNLETNIFLSESNVLFLDEVDSFFAEFSTIIFYKTNNLTEYIPLKVFKNTTKANILVYNQAPSNMFKIKNDPSENIDIEIENFEFRNSIIDRLDQSLFGDLFLNKIKSFAIKNSELFSIQREFFKNLPELNKLELNLKNFKQFILNSQNEWMEFLNSFDTGLKQFTLELNDLTNEYDFPSQDFCNFKYFKFEDKNLITIINSKPYLECSCTIASLINKSKLENESLVRTESTKNCFEISETDFDVLINQCKILNCQNKPITEFESESTTDFQKISTNENIINSTVTQFLTTISLEYKPSTTADKNKKLLQALYISLGAVSVGFLLLSMFSIFIFLRYKRLRSFKSDVAYEISSYSNTVFDG